MASGRGLAAIGDLQPRPLMEIIEQRFGDDLGQADGGRELDASGYDQRDDHRVDGAGYTPGERFGETARMGVHRFPPKGWANGPLSRLEETEQRYFAAETKTVLEAVVISSPSTATR